MPDRALFKDYRLKVVRLGLVVSWVALGAYVIGEWRDSSLDDAEVLTTVLTIGGGLLLLSIAPWKRLLLSSLGDSFLVLWSVLAVGGIIAGHELRDGGPVPEAYLAVVVFFAAALVAPYLLALIGALGLGGFIASMVAVSDPSYPELALRSATFLLVVGLAVGLSRGIENQLRAAASRLRELDVGEQRIVQRENELEQMYAVSRTVGVASNLAEVLPELMGRVVAAVDAKVGLVLLYHSEEQALEVMSPIWVAGHTLKAEGYILPLSEPGFAQHIFTTGEPAINNSLPGGQSKGKLLSDLDARNVAGVPLRIESRSIGVLLVADKASGEYNEDDLTKLESLASPSALVLSQMTRYEQARETGEKMAELAQLKTDFVSVVSHELRTPLTSIIGALSVLARPDMEHPDQNARDLVASAERQAKRLKSLIEDLLVVSRIDNRALPVRPEAIEVASFLRDVVAETPDAERRALIDVAEDVDHLQADPHHLRRMISNLLTNALKYAAGSSVEVHARPNGSDVWISVVDHGAGIPYELHEHIFDRFTQVERPDTRAKGGTGLGLSIVRGLSEAMGGRVWFEPTVGGGATFTVSLPSAARSYQVKPPQSAAPRIDG